MKNLSKNIKVKSKKKYTYLFRIKVDVTVRHCRDRYDKRTTNPIGRPRGRPVVSGDAALKWLKEYLKDGPKYSGNKKAPQPGTVFGDALLAGFKCNTLWRAAEKCGVVKCKEAISRRGLWSLPEEQ